MCKWSWHNVPKIILKNFWVARNHGLKQTFSMRSMKTPPEFKNSHSVLPKLPNAPKITTSRFENFQSRHAKCFVSRDETAPHLRGIITQHLHFGGVNRRFRAKLVKYQHLHIIEATASIPTKFCTSIKTPPNTLCGLSKHAHITNPRWRKVAIMKISKNRHISMDRLPRNFAKWRTLALSTVPIVRNCGF